MAVISTARDEACRKGLYASPSITTPSTVHTTMASSTDTSGVRPQYAVAQNDMYAPIMITSPWAKFSILAMPYTMV